MVNTKCVKSLPALAVQVMRSLDDLGFEDTRAALQSVLSHADFEQRWDCGTGEQRRILRVWRSKTLRAVERAAAILKDGAA